jgi:[ribosomal protein S5]-alanine N-acetyltransferase
MRMPIQFPLLETKRLLLRRLNADDAPQIFQLRSDEMHNQFIDRPRATGMEDAESFIKKINALVENKESLFWAIQLKGASTLAGTMVLWEFDTEANKAELGYELLSMHQGKGIMNEAFRKVLDFTFYDLQLLAVEAWTHPRNKRSSSVLQKLGFVRDEEAEKRKPADAIEDIYSLKAACYSYK